MDIERLLTRNFCNAYKINTDIKYEIEYINARELIVPGRIDLVAKFKYVEHKVNNHDVRFVKDLYKKHIEAFSKGTYIEPGNEDKNSIEKYILVFNELIENIRINGVDHNQSVIPVGKNNEIMDGAHRTAIAAYFNQSVPIIRFNELEANNNLECFKNLHLDELYLDYLANEYCKIDKDTYIAIFWPKASGESNFVKAFELLNEKTDVVYKKSIKLSFNGLRNLMIQVYNNHDWMQGFENHFFGAEKKVEACYQKDKDTIILILKSNSFENILEVKNEIRELFGIGNHSIHISDNNEETQQLSKILFNNNTIFFLNHGKPDKYIELNKRLILFKNRVLANGLSLDDFIVESSAILGLYGLRIANDIDYLSIAEDHKLIENEFIENHIDYLKYHDERIQDLIYNPNNYFVYNDIKFIDLENLRRFKKNRNEPKDIDDIKLIDSVYSNKNKISKNILHFKGNLKRKIRNYKYSTRMQIVSLTKKIKVYNALKQLKYSLRRKK